MRIGVAAGLVALGACSGSAVELVARDGGAGISAQSVPAVSGDPQSFQSGQRIKALVGRTAEGLKEFHAWFDTQRNEECSFLRWADGSRRCTPPLWYLDPTFFADSACVHPLVMLAPCEVEFGRYIQLLHPANGCGRSDGPFFKLGARHGGPLYRRDPSGEICGQLAPSDREAALTDGAPYLLGEALVATDFVAMTETLE
jgi:hypothetical protein